MKKFLLFLLWIAFTGTSSLYGQAWDQVANSWVRLDGGLALPAGYLTIKDETTALAQENVLTFLGAGVTCVDNAGNTATECTIPGGGGSTPTGTGFVHVTGGVQDGASKTVDVSTADITGLLPYANLANGSAISVLGRSANSSGVNAPIQCTAASSALVRESGSSTLTCATITLLNGNSISDTASGSAVRGSVIVGNSTPKWAAVTIGAQGTFLGSNGTDTAFIDPNQLTETATPPGVVLIDEEWCGVARLSRNTFGTAPSVANTASGGTSHPCIRTETGAAATGGVAWEAFNTNTNTVTPIETLANTTFITIEGSIRVNSVGDGTDVIKYYLGGCSTANSGDCNTGLYLRYDRSASTTNWFLCASNNGTRTCTDTTLAVATGSTWTNWRIVQNLANNALSCTINGSACAAGPTTNHPAGGNGFDILVKMDKTAGATTQFIMDIDYLKAVMFGLARN